MLDFSDGQYLLPMNALSKGPDVLRPGSSTSKYGAGRTAFFYTKYPDESGKRLHSFGAGDGHEKHITRPEIMRGFFGPNLEKIKPEISYNRPIYGDYDPEKGERPEIGSETDYNHWELRSRALKDNLIGRYGDVQGIPTLMFWGIPENGGWDMVNDVIDQLGVSKDTRIVNLTQEMGPVWKFKEVFKGLDSNSKKKLKTDQDMERIKALSRYHVATGAEKESLKRKFGFGNNTDVSYPNTKTMSPEEIEKYPWNRKHWKKKSKELGISNPFDYGENFSFREFLKLF